MAKQKRKPTAWNLHTMKVWREMKKKNNDVKFSDALKAAAKTFKKIK